MTSNFSLSEALIGAIWAQAAYGEVSLPVGYTLGVNSELRDFRPADDVQVLVARGNGRLVISFRGTVDMRGWLVDAEVKLRDYPEAGKGVKVHTGFWSTVKAVMGWLAPIVENAVKDGLKICIYGHSKGAAEAMVCAARLACEWKIKSAVLYTFGQPRVFNHAGANAFNALGIPTWRVVDEDDSVTRIPLLLGLYRHAGRTAFIDHWLNIELDEPFYAHLPSDIECAIEELFHRQDFLSRDHNVSLYVQRLTIIQLAQGVTG